MEQAAKEAAQRIIAAHKPTDESDALTVARYVVSLLQAIEAVRTPPASRPSRFK